MRALGVAALALALSACTEATPPQTPARAAEPTYAMELRSPERVPYAPALLGTGPTRVSVVVSNRGEEPLDVSKLALRLEAARDGVAIQCIDPSDDRSAEPSVLRPGESHTFERSLDCRLPIAGRYRVTAFVAFGADRSWRSVRRYELEVTAPPGLEGRAIDDSGLVATIGSAPVVGGANELAHPRVALALTNTGATPLELPLLRVETRVRHAGSPWSCTSSPKRLAAPPSLAAGGVHREPFDVSCLGFDAPGVYDVEIVLLIGSDRSESLGHLRIEVQDDPARLRHAPFP